MEDTATIETPAGGRDTLEHEPRRRRAACAGLGSLTGLAAAGAGLAAAEVASIGDDQLQSPVLDVGDRVVDGVPNSVKTLAIDWFGTNDKLALLIGIGSILAIYAIVLGIVSLTRRWHVAIVGAAAFGLIGAYASQTTRRDAPFYAVTPSVVGGAVAAGVLWWLRRRAVPTAGERPNGDAPPAGDLDRRRLLVATGITAAGAVVVGATGRRLSTRSNVAAQRDQLGLPFPDERLAPIEPDASADGAVPFVTPNDDFYRIDTALTVPKVSVDSWQLDIDGMVRRPFSLTYEELVSRPIVEADITLTCVSNEVGGKLIGNARWLGVRLDELLDEAGIEGGADQIVGRSVDGYTCGFPVRALDGRDALIAIGMNGEPLPLEHGYPARLIVPGLYGYVSATKWLQQIELTRFDQFDQYWVDRGWVEDAPIKLQSRIDTPRGLGNVSAGTVPIAGVAWAQTRGIDAVELRIDDDEWVATRLTAEHDIDTWRQWSYAWNATPGRHTITVRATERGGAIQSAERTEPFPSGATGQHQIVVIVD
jgi:DMSO/TMAO reductase YedYZ molybdopterin-dependent catalytic subunit